MSSPPRHAVPGNRSSDWRVGYGSAARPLRDRCRQPGELQPRGAAFRRGRSRNSHAHGTCRRSRLDAARRGHGAAGIRPGRDWSARAVTSPITAVDRRAPMHEFREVLSRSRDMSRKGFAHDTRRNSQPPRRRRMRRQYPSPLSRVHPTRNQWRHATSVSGTSQSHHGSDSARQTIAHDTWRRPLRDCRREAP